MTATPVWNSGGVLFPDWVLLGQWGQVTYECESLRIGIATCFFMIEQSRKS